MNIRVTIGGGEVLSVEVNGKKYDDFEVVDLDNLDENEDNDFLVTNTDED